MPDATANAAADCGAPLSQTRGIGLWRCSRASASLADRIRSYTALVHSSRRERSAGAACSGHAAGAGCGSHAVMAGPNWRRVAVVALGPSSRAADTSALECTTIPRSGSDESCACGGRGSEYHTCAAAHLPPAPARAPPAAGAAAARGRGSWIGIMERSLAVAATSPSCCTERTKIDRSCGALGLGSGGVVASTYPARLSAQTNTEQHTAAPGTNTRSASVAGTPRRSSVNSSLGTLRERGKLHEMVAREKLEETSARNPTSGARTHPKSATRATTLRRRATITRSTVTTASATVACPRESGDREQKLQQAIVARHARDSLVPGKSTVSVGFV